MTVSPVYRGAPAEKRPDPEQRCYDVLDTLGIGYDRVDHDAAFTMEDCEAISAALGVPICKNLVLTPRNKSAYYLLCLPGDKPFHTKDLSAQINSSRLSFAPEDSLWELLHCHPGSATVLGLANDTEHRVQLLLDREVYDAPYMSCHPCICTSTLKLKTSDVLTRLLPHTGHTPIVVDL